MHSKKIFLYFSYVDDKELVRVDTIGENCRHLTRPDAAGAQPQMEQERNRGGDGTREDNFGKMS